MDVITKVADIRPWVLLATESQQKLIFQPGCRQGRDDLWHPPRLFYSRNGCAAEPHPAYNLDCLYVLLSILPTLTRKAAHTKISANAHMVFGR